MSLTYLVALSCLLHVVPVLSSVNSNRGVTVILDSSLSKNTTGTRERVLAIIRRSVPRETEAPAIQGIYEDRGYSILSAFCRALAVERAAVVGSLPLRAASLFESLTGAFNFPYITWDAITLSFEPPASSPRDCKMFSVRPDVTQALVDFLVTWNWKTFAYLYGSANAFKRLQYISQRVAPQQVQGDNDRTLPLMTSGYVGVEDPEVIHKTLKAVDTFLSTKAERNVIIDIGRSVMDQGRSGRDRLETIFMWLSRMGMMRTEYNYLLVDFNIFELSLDDYQRGGVNVTGFHFLDYQNDAVRKFAARWNDSKLPLHDIAFMMDALEVAWGLKKATDRGLWNNRDADAKSTCFTSSGALVSEPSIQRWQPGDRIKSWLTQTDISGQTGLVRLDRQTCQRTDYNLLLSSAFGKLPDRIIAKWSRHSSWVLPTQSTNPGFFHLNVFPTLKEKIAESVNYNNLLEIFRLQNRTLRVVSVLSKPFIMYANPEVVGATSGRHNFVGYCKDLADHIFARLNLNYEIHLVKDGKFGTIDPATGEWNGMVGEVLRDEADLIIAPLTMNIIRATFIDFSEPFMNFGLSLMLRKPGKTKPGMFSFLSPLTNAVWLRMAGATIVVGLGLRLIAAISPKERSPADPSLGFNLGNCMWFSVASFVHQGIDIFPVSPGARVFASIWRYVCLVVMAYYTANLAAALSVERLISPINSIKDFAERDDLPIQIGTLDSGATKDFFAHAEGSFFKTIYQKMERDPSVYVPTMAAGFERVRTKPYAFVAESKMIEYINHRQPCDTMMVGNTFGSKAYAVGLPSNRPEMRILKEHVTDAILRLRENQVLAKLYKEWWVEKGECVEGGEQQTSEPLALINLSGVFYILIVGMVLSVTIGVIVFIYQLHNSKKRAIS
ncbi:unnamed protein product [Mesocestoides corti]|uniref:Glutamate receptor n=1 Tax=Mesocestoides corti TaxID=53468 RepID=A0A0R3U5H3_MESCO|nr:unnamed protein product [Mesocestoides corti]